MTERAFKKIVWSDSISDNAFNYLFVLVFIVLGFYWLIRFELGDTFSYKIILSILSVLLPFLFASSMIRGITNNNKVLNITSDDTVEHKEQILKEYLASKKKSKEHLIKDNRVKAYEYYTSFGIPVYLYVFIDDEKVLLNVKRKDNFSIKEIFDYGLTKRAQNKAISFFEKSLIKKAV